MDTLSSIVTVDGQISQALEAGDSFRLERLMDLYRSSHDKNGFVATLMVRLMLEHDRRALASEPL